MEIKKSKIDSSSTFIAEYPDTKLLNSMTDFVRIVGFEDEILFENVALQNFCEKVISDTRKRNKLGISTPLFNTKLSYTTLHSSEAVAAELCIRDHVFSVKTTPIYKSGNLYASMEVYRDITEQSNLTVELFGANQKIQQEMKLARSIQTSMLPSITDYGPIHFDYEYIPSEELSGDFFDLIPLGAGKIGLYITDVVGHGVSASILTMFVRQAMRNILGDGKMQQPAKVLESLQKRFAQIGLDDSQYFSIFYAVINTRRKTITYANAGHNCEPLLLHHGKVDTLHSTGMLISNLAEYADYHQTTVDLEEGYRVLFYTDGVVETLDENENEFGVERLKDLFREHSEEALEKIISELDSFRVGDQKDDIALLMVATN